MKRRLVIAAICALQLLLASGCVRIPDIESAAISRLPGRRYYSEIDWAPAGDRFIAVGIPAPPGVDANLFLVDASTGREERLPVEPWWYSHPRWSPDGTKIALTQGLSEIWLLDLATNDLALIGEGEGSAWSPSGDRLAVYVGETVDRTQSTQAVQILATDGSLVVSHDLDFTGDPEWKSDLSEESPAFAQYLRGLTWSPLFEEIAFSLYTFFPEHERASEAFVLDVETSRLRSFSGTRAIGLLDWSPDGSHIAYVLVDDYLGYLVIEDFLGNCVFAPEIPPKVRDLAWSPDGNSLAFIFDNSIHIADIDQISQHAQPLALCP